LNQKKFQLHRPNLTKSNHILLEIQKTKILTFTKSSSSTWIHFWNKK